MKKEKRKKRRKKRRRKKRGADPRLKEGRRNTMGGWNWWPAVGGNDVRKKRCGSGWPRSGRPLRPTTSATLFFDFF
jgi:hypothetical protein